MLASLVVAATKLSDVTEGWIEILSAVCAAVKSSATADGTSFTVNFVACPVNAADTVAGALTGPFLMVEVTGENVAATEPGFTLTVNATALAVNVSVTFAGAAATMSLAELV